MAKEEDSGVSLWSVGGLGVALILGSLAANTLGFRRFGGKRIGKAGDRAYRDFSKATKTDKIPDEAFTSQGMKPPREAGNKPQKPRQDE